MATELPTVDRAERCDTCRWWLLTDRENSTGECRRHAPRPTLTPEVSEKDEVVCTPLAYFPVTWDEWFCGEWTPIKEQPK